MKQPLFDHLSADPEVWRARAAALRLRCLQSSDDALCQRLSQLAEHYEQLAGASEGAAATG